ncbi:hypothetical protein LIER_11333 [Lithospermum erythrorhizon]|uniref:Pentatricopeptide repeat-containing protein n=1 Tax=Lithospermum erythrorhizon TaxID=34254 RepID=A0AAV3PQJ5_LITER
MSRSVSIALLARQINLLKVTRSLYPLLNFNTLAQHRSPRHSRENLGDSNEDRYNNQITSKTPEIDTRALAKYQIGENVSRKDKIKILVSTLLGPKDSKEAIYGVLDAWVAWEQKFPIGPLKNVLLALEKEQQWHRVIQVIKWMLSKGQGNTMGTYGQLIYALDMDRRAKEAHEIWMKKVNSDLHSTSWKLCNLMISVYYRNNMLEDLVKLFKGLEAFDRKPTEKSAVQKVADAYEMLGLLDEKERVMEKYKNLFEESSRVRTNKSKGSQSLKITESVKRSKIRRDEKKQTNDCAQEEVVT